MTVAWRIDSLDARAGLAVASLREPDLHEAAPALDIPAIFLAPPVFRPEALGTRAVGFAAARGQAQLGLFIDGAEVGFETLEALTEFVRRAYVSSGGGDAPGTGGGGPGPEPSPSPEPSPGEGRERGSERPIEPSPTTQAIVWAGKRAAETSLRLQLSAEAPSPSEVFSAELVGRQGAAGEDGRALATGAAELLVALLSVCPMRGDAQSRRAWLRRSQPLTRAISDLGLWRMLSDGPDRAWLDAEAMRLAQSLRPRPEVDRRFLPVMLELGPWGLERWYDSDLDWLIYGPRILAPALWGSGRRSADPLDSLAEWPLPQDVADLVGLGRDDATAFHLVSLLSASPAKLASPGSFQAAHAAAAILVFSVAHILAEPQLGGALDLTVEPDRAIESVGASLEWIRRQWPSLLFPAPLEAAIEAAGKRVAA